MIYHRAREDSHGLFSSTTTIIVDGMDQNKTNLPHFALEDTDKTENSYYR
jgi:hypothetical protein